MKTATAIFVTLILLVMVNCSSGDDILQACDMPASMWMKASKSERDVYMIGFLGGMAQTIRILDKELVFKQRITYAVISEKVYMHLLAHPELRSGPIGLIIIDALKGYMTIKDR